MLLPLLIYVYCGIRTGAFTGHAVRTTFLSAPLGILTLEPGEGTVCDNTLQLFRQTNEGCQSFDNSWLELIGSRLVWNPSSCHGTTNAPYARTQSAPSGSDEFSIISECMT